MEKHDIVIIGGGIAGLSLGKFLAEEGLDFVLLEEHKDFFMKACGEGMGTKINDYYFFDLYESKKGIEREINECIISTKYGKISLETNLLTINKKEVEKELANQAIKKGANIRMNEKVISIKKDGNFILEPQRIETKIIIGADGSFSLVKNYLGIKKPKFAIGASGINKEIERDKDKCYLDLNVRYGYSWFFPKKEEWNIGIGSLSLKKFKESFKKFKEKYKVKWKGGHVPISKSFELGRKNIFLVGDAACQVRGIVGAGNLLSMVSARILADSIKRKKDYKKIWMERIGKKIKRENKIALAISKFMINDYATHLILKSLSKIAPKNL